MGVDIDDSFWTVVLFIVLQLEVEFSSLIASELKREPDLDHSYHPLIVLLA